MPSRHLSLLGLLVLIGATPAAGTASATLVADLFTGLDSSGSSYGIERPLLPVGDKVLFVAFESSVGRELWVSDGTSLGTSLVLDLCPGECSSSILFLGTQGRSALFLAGEALWRSDGTRGGTVPVVTADQGGPVPCTLEPLQAATLNGVILFTASSEHRCVVWRTDGTRAGTRPLLSELYSFGPEELLREPLVVANRLFFFANDEDGEALWLSDGTGTGTVLLHLFPRTFTTPLDRPRFLTALGSRVFFLARGEKGGDEELWTSDGTAAGTRPVTRFSPPLPFASTLFLKALDGALYFTAEDVTGGVDLWRSDGTADGTKRVTDFAGRPFLNNLIDGQLAKPGEQLVFLAATGPLDWQIWTSAGTPATTKPLAGCPGGCPDDYYGPSFRFAAVGKRVVFPAEDGLHGEEPWSTDGTGAGTRRLGDLCPEFCNSSPSGFTPGFGRLLFVARGGIWSTDGTPQKTVRLAGLRTDDLELVFAGRKAFFVAGDSLRGSQLWVTDGTPGGTELVSVIGSNGVSSAPRELTPFGSDLMFAVGCASQEYSQGVWRSGGTAASTLPLLPTLAFCSTTRLPHALEVSGGLLFFLKEDLLEPERLWRSDGTDAGTFPVTDPGLLQLGAPVAFRNGVVFSSLVDSPGLRSLWTSDGSVAGTHKLVDVPKPFLGPWDLWALGEELYFMAADSSNTDQLWVTDGTEEGTHQLTSFTEIAFDSSRPSEMAQLGETVFFVADRELWKTDGTAAGTARALPDGDIDGSNPTELTEFGGALYFMGSIQSDADRRGLWRSDGTAAVTVLVKSVARRYEGSEPEPAWLTPLGSLLFFVADDGEHGLELWQTNGTAEGTQLVRDIASGVASSRPRELAVAGGRLYFTATDGVHGVELWESDGSAVGTRMVQDIAPGGLASNPRELTAAGGRLFFAADDGVHGSELWALPLASPSGCQSSEEALCLGGRFRVEADWRDFAGNSGRGKAVSLTADTGYFWFFDPANVEVILKVLDGRSTNGHQWVFYGALSNVEYTLTVTDTQTGAARRYSNPPGRLGSVADTVAFGPRGATGSALTYGPAAVATEPTVRTGRAVAAASCTPSATRLCLQGGRFAVEARWKDFQGKTGAGQAVPLSGGDTGYFWFFGPDNVEVVLKVLDGRPLNGKHWVFYGALSSVEYTLTVTDTQTGKVRTYTNPSGRLASVADTGAF